MHTSEGGTETLCRFVRAKLGTAIVMFSPGVNTAVPAGSIRYRRCEEDEKGLEAKRRQRQENAQAETERTQARQQQEKERDKAAWLKLCDKRQTTKENSADRRGREEAKHDKARGQASHEAQKRREWQASLAARWAAMEVGEAAKRSRKAKKVAGRVRALAEETAKAMDTTMSEAVQAVTGCNIVNWTHGVQVLRMHQTGTQPEMVAAVSELALALGTNSASVLQLGKVLQSTVAEVGKQEDSQKVRSAEVAAAQEVYERQRFHAVRISIGIVGQSECAPAYAVGDSGAAPSLYPLSGLSVEVQKSSIRPGRARLMHSASAHNLGSKGGAKLNFTLGDCPHVFNNEFQITDGGGVPAILGVEFWDEYESKFDFKRRAIEMTLHDGSAVHIPFSIGDERRNEEHVAAVYCLEDVVVPPRHDRHTC